MRPGKFSCSLAASLIATTALVAAASDQQAIAEFTKRANQYVQLRADAKREVPNLPKAAMPEQIVNYEQALAAEIRTRRAGAKPGDVFCPEVRPIFLKILKQNLQGPQNQDSRQMARGGNPLRESEPGEAPPVVAVNAVYPSSAPLSSVPPILLLQLPRLPQHVEYRFVGQTLILWDSESKLIIDYLKGAAPGV